MAGCSLQPSRFGLQARASRPEACEACEACERPGAIAMLSLALEFAASSQYRYHSISLTCLHACIPPTNCDCTCLLNNGQKPRCEMGAGAAGRAAASLMGPKTASSTPHSANTCPCRALEALKVPSSRREPQNVEQLPRKRNTHNPVSEKARHPDSRQAPATKPQPHRNIGKGRAEDIPTKHGAEAHDTARRAKRHATEKENQKRIRKRRKKERKGKTLLPKESAISELHHAPLTPYPGLSVITLPQLSLTCIHSGQGLLPQATIPPLPRSQAASPDSGTTAVAWCCGL